MTVSNKIDILDILNNLINLLRQNQFLLKNIDHIFLHKNAFFKHSHVQLSDIDSQIVAELLIATLSEYIACCLFDSQSFTFFTLRLFLVPSATVAEEGRMRLY